MPAGRTVSALQRNFLHHGRKERRGEVESPTHLKLHASAYLIGCPTMEPGTGPHTCHHIGMLSELLTEEERSSRFLTEDRAMRTVLSTMISKVPAEMMSETATEGHALLENHFTIIDMHEIQYIISQTL